MKTLLAMSIVNVFTASAYAMNPKIALGVRVVDEEMRPFTGMPIVCIFTDRTYLGDEIYSVATNVTKNGGIARFKGRSYDGWVDYRIPNVEGFYQIDGILTRFTNATETLVSRWLPYDEVQVVTLQRKGKPIPLFVRHEDSGRFRDLTTEPDGKFYYDLVKGAWLPPFGKGVQADIEFSFLPRKDFGVHIGLSGYPGRSYRDEIVLRFIGDGNGIVSVLPPPNAVLKIREAPLEGYEQKHVSWRGRNKDIQPERSDCTEKCQAFRIRTRKNAEGKIASALYGKVYGGFPLTYRGADHPSGVEFTYYLNPIPNDQNLEWDMKHNLCPVRESFNHP